MTVKTKPQARLKRRRRVRAKVRGTAERPRISVFRSNRGISAQLIDDDAGRTLAAVNWTEAELRELAADRAGASRPASCSPSGRKAAGVAAAVFDRGGYQYHGRVKALAEGAREGGLTLLVALAATLDSSWHDDRTVSARGPRPPGARRRDQPRRQGGQGRPPLLVHRAGRRRRRARGRRHRLRQGQRGPASRSRRASSAPRRTSIRVPKHGSTITHQTIGVFGAGRVFLKPAAPGTGVIAGGGVRAVLELAGIHDILSKSLGSQNPINLVKATMAGLESLRTPVEVAELRGLSINQVLGLTGESGPTTAEHLSTAATPARRRGSAGSAAEADAPVAAATDARPTPTAPADERGVA